jgi:hypothetical protein
MLQTGNWLQLFVQFAMTEIQEELGVKVGHQDHWFGCVGSAAIASRRLCNANTNTDWNSSVLGLI